MHIIKRREKNKYMAKNKILDKDDYVYINGKFTLTKEYYLKRNLPLPKEYR